MSDAPSSMVERVVLILGVFARSSGALTLGQISSRSRLPRSSVHRILQQLVTARWIERRDNDYSLGLRMFEIGSHVEQRTRFSEVARPLMQDLSAATGHVVHLALLDEQDVVYLEKIGGSFGGSLPSRVGGRLPAHCTGVGKVLLAYSSRAVIEEYKQSGMKRQTNASIINGEALDAALSSIRNLGYATERGEAVPGVGCVGAPIFEFGDAVAAISACGPQQRMRVDELRHRVMWTSAEISRRLTALRYPPGRPAEPIPMVDRSANMVDFPPTNGTSRQHRAPSATRQEDPDMLEDDRLVRTVTGRR